jgi:bifunctional DNase/RNase
VARPLTYDLLRSIISAVDLEVDYVVVNALRNETFYATIMVDFNGKTLEIDARPSDAIALAVRVSAPVFVAESVMDEASVTPQEGIDLAELTMEEEARLSVFSEFLETLDLDELDDTSKS